MKYFETEDGVGYLKFESFEKTGLVNHCFSTRRGGVSEGPYASLNLSFHKGDNPENVSKNIRALCKAVDIDETTIVMSKQTHTTNLYHVTEEDKGKGITKENNLNDIDGMITNHANISLMTFYADCVPLFFLDPVKKVIALSHAGWRGTVNGIGTKTVEEMVKVYGSLPKDILAGIGPSIGPCCFQVDDPVAEEFHEKIPFADEVIRPDGDLKGKYKIDLWKTNMLLLKQAGLLAENISISGLCTMCDGSMFYSHRTQGPVRGSLAAFLSLKGR